MLSKSLKDATANEDNYIKITVIKIWIIQIESMTCVDVSIKRGQILYYMTVQPSVSRSKPSRLHLNANHETVNQSVGTIDINRSMPWLTNS